MKLKFFNLKKLVTVTCITALLCQGMAFSTFAADKLYDQVNTQVITKGVTYEENRRLTAEGWQDIYVMKIALNDPNIQFAPVESSTQYGLKETVVKMLTDANAVGGVNASFFGMNGQYSASFGVTMKEGKLVSVGTDINNDKNEYASFFVDKTGNPFIHFLKTNLEFYANGQSFFDIVSVNKVTDMLHPMYFDRNAGSNTEALDARFADLAKIVVENNVITKISAKGEIVEVPENGYLIIMSGTTYDYNVQNFSVGQTAEFKVTASLDLNQIQTAVSGAGLILSEGGQVAAPGMVIGKRQPRSALGISEDKNTLILMAVDGRGSSIGATQTEMAYLMKEYGAFNAMHFDGGGSTTFVAKTIEDEILEVKNNPSEANGRKVINAFGVFNNAPTGELSQIEIKPSSEKAFKGSPITLEIIGYDDYYHEVPVSIENVEFASSDAGGIFQGNTFTPSIDGQIIITATYNGLNAVASIEGMTLAQLTPSLDTVSLGVGENVTLSFTGTSTNGFTAPVKNVNLFSNLGTAEGQKFTALTSGASYIEASFGGIVSYIKLGVATPLDGIAIPASMKYTDPKKAAISGKEDGYYYINMVGQVLSNLDQTKKDPIYENSRTAINQKIQQNADLAVYVGQNQMAVENPIDTISWNSGYHFYDKGNVSIVQMTAATGTLRTSNTWQWQAFKSDVLKSQSKNVIFIMDRTPSNFTDRLEGALFISILDELRSAGKEIFVVSSGQGEGWNRVKDGIRYINLPSLWNADGSYNSNFQLLTFKLNGDTIQYEIKNLN